MKHVEMTILARDADRVIEFLGRRAVMHISNETPSLQEGVQDNVDTGPAFGSPSGAGQIKPLIEGEEARIRSNLDKVQHNAGYLGVELPIECEDATRLPGEREEALVNQIDSALGALSRRENEIGVEKRRVEETLSEARAFENLNARFADLDQLSYLTLRVGRLEPRKQVELRERLADRAVIVPLGSGAPGMPGDRFLMAASRKGRFALDSELKKLDFAPITIPEDYTGVPKEILSGLDERLGILNRDLEVIGTEKEKLRGTYGAVLRNLAASYLMASQVEALKSRLRATQSVYVLSGWVPADTVRGLVKELGELTEGRVAVRAYNPEELSKIQEGREKVPVSLEHGGFVKGFEGVVFSYGAPLYGTIDPTPFVAFFFTILFGIMFGDLGQGMVLLLLGLLTGKRGTRLGLKALAKLRGYSSPLIAVGISSMVMGLFTGSVFANEELLTGLTRAVTGFFIRLLHLTGPGGELLEPAERILHLMPEKGNIARLFYFFGFTVAVGVALNSIGLLVNVINQYGLKNYEKAFFSKTGLSGLFLFWYALFIAIRIIAGGRFVWLDLAGLIAPIVAIFFGPAIWRFISGERPVLEHGLLVFIMEGFVEILETVSTYISNTVSFLRVGAFALSHAVLSFIVFTLSGMVAKLPAGSLFALVIMVFGNTVIILLEGMIVAIQVVRLQYYEFFSKFFTETGVEFSPFRFRKK
jgi:V/A-type H+-transporting ATPase subunit I